MKIILSRRGFDKFIGGYPSLHLIDLDQFSNLIVPEGEPFSFNKDEGYIVSLERAYHLGDQFQDYWNSINAIEY